jgi:DNA-binding NtrC family response regulator
MIPNYDILLNYSDTGVLRMLEWALKDHGLTVTSVHHADEAIEALGRRHYDVVLTDFDTDTQQGMKVLERAKIRDPETVVIMIGCREPHHYDQEDLPAEADEFVFTPCGAPKLWKRVSGCLERLELRRRDAHCRDSRRQLVALAGEMKRLRDGEYGAIDGVATAKLTNLLQAVDTLISEASGQLVQQDAAADMSGVGRRAGYGTHV